jgi:hypothetical protein
MVGCRRSGIAWVCTLVLVLQTLASAMVVGRAAAAQIDPFAGIAICGSRIAAAAHDGGPGTPDGDHHGQACPGECCWAACCFGPLMAMLPQLRQLAVRQVPAAAAGMPARSIALPAQRVADRFQARAPPVSL